MTKATNVTISNSQAAHGRHKSQGPMRSEKVYHMTSIMKEKIQQLNGEHASIKQHYEAVDEKHDQVKDELRRQYVEKRKEQLDMSDILEQKEQEMEDLNKKEEEIRANYIKMMENIQDHTNVVKLG